MLGTPSYMSPEQYMGEATDGRTDIFSAGVILYELLTGERPFTGDSSGQIMQKILHETPVNPSELNPLVPPPVDWVLQKALAKDVGRPLLQCTRVPGRALQRDPRCAARTTRPTDQPAPPVPAR